MGCFVTLARGCMGDAEPRAQGTDARRWNVRGGTAGVDAGFGGRFSNESCRITAAQSSSSSRSRLRLRRSMRETCTCET